MKTVLYGLANRPFIPEELRGSKRRLILHISDTPSDIYPFLYQVVEQLNPLDLIHTGDLADNYKIEFQKFHLSHYQRAVSSFVHHLQEISEARLHIVLGNHDDPDTLAAILPGFPMQARCIELNGRLFYVMHKLDKLPQKPGYYCFGHRFEPANEETRKYVLLNGLLNLNVIDVDTWQVFHLEYPVGTNGYRKMTKGRIGL
ncbi:MAG: metallophosphoesterase [Bacillota bacterium]|nr:metallophosphoesterase [Bacillota bacterium]